MEKTFETEVLTRLRHYRKQIRWISAFKRKVRRGLYNI